MQRRNFITITAAAIPVLATAGPPGEKKQQPVKAFVVHNGKSRFNEKTMVAAKSPNDIKVSSKDTGGQLTVFNYTGNEKGGPPLHLHLHQDEIFFIVSGEYRFRVGEEIFTLTPGDTIFLPRQIPHSFAQLSDKGQMFFMFQPAGTMEDFFRAMDAVPAESTPADRGKIFARHGMKVVGPPLEI